MEDLKYPGRIKVRVVLDPRFGEVYFEIEASKKTTVKNKCLYDALSDFGIEMARAKHIVRDLAISINTGKFYHLDPIDYIEHGREERYEIESRNQARFSPAKL